MKIVVITGGVGGAKLVVGLNEIVPAADLTAIVNTGDDFRHMGLHVSPDIDTLLYTLSGKASRTHGWGREEETWTFMTALRELGGEEWFALGDGDLALHVQRSWRLEQGYPLSRITRDFATGMGIAITVLPMSDDPVRTALDTDCGQLEFQRYFVEQRCAPRVKQIVFLGSEAARAGPGVLASIGNADVIIIAPSNPYLSVDPVLAVPELRSALASTKAPVVAVSPLIRGEAVKGPTAKLMRELGLGVTNASIAGHYSELLDGLLIHQHDDAPNGLRTARTDTMMLSLDDKVRVARASLAFALDIGS